MIHVPLNPQRISQALGNEIGYWRVKVISETTSTQSEIKNVYSPIQHGDLLITDFQKNGRGRLNRNFIAPPTRALLFSTFLKPERSNSDWGWFPLIIGLSVAESLSEITGKSFLTKWPNDVQHEGKKVSGILCESNQVGIIAGIGINVNFASSELPVENATALNIIVGREFERELVLAEILKKISANLKLWNLKQDQLIFEKYLKNSATIGKNVNVELGNGNIISANAIGISNNGELILDNGDAVSIGDVTHLR